MSSMGHWVNGCWQWEFSWSRQLNHTESANLHYLEGILRNVMLLATSKDKWKWSIITSNSFIVSSYYSFILSLLLSMELHSDILEVFIYVVEGIYAIKSEGILLEGDVRTNANQ